MQGIEDVKELFLGFLFSAKKLNVIHNEHIDIFVENRKLTCAVVPDRLNKLISKALRGDVENSQFVLKLLLYPISDTLDQVCFSQDRKSTRLNSSHVAISYAVFCLKKKN